MRKYPTFSLKNPGKKENPELNDKTKRKTKLNQTPNSYLFGRLSKFLFVLLDALCSILIIKSILPRQLSAMAARERLQLHPGNPDSPWVFFLLLKSMITDFKSELSTDK